MYNMLSLTATDLVQSHIKAANNISQRRLPTNKWGDITCLACGKTGFFTPF